MSFPEPIKVVGLKDRRAALKDIGDGSHKELRRVYNAAGERIATGAQRRVEVGATGKARRSVRMTSTQTRARVSGGGARAKHYPWLDFGGRVGKNRSVSRPFKKEGRYIYREFFDHRREVYADMEEGLAKLVEAAGLEPV